MEDVPSSSRAFATSLPEMRESNLKNCRSMLQTYFRTRLGLMRQTRNIKQLLLSNYYRNKIRDVVCVQYIYIYIEEEKRNSFGE